MDIIRIVGAGLIAAVLALTIKKQSPEIGLIISIAASVLIFLMVLPPLAALMEMLRALAARVDTNMVYIHHVLRVVGIAYIAEFGTQICTDAGESAIASKIEIGGKILIMIASAPILLSLVDLILNLLP